MRCIKGHGYQNTTKITLYNLVAGQGESGAGGEMVKKTSLAEGEPAEFVGISKETVGLGHGYHLVEWEVLCFLAFIDFGIKH